MWDIFKGKRRKIELKSLDLELFLLLLHHFNTGFLIDQKDFLVLPLDFKQSVNALV